MAASGNGPMQRDNITMMNIHDFSVGTDVACRM